jgi:hypothetical protein
MREPIAPNNLKNFIGMADANKSKAKFKRETFSLTGEHSDYINLCISRALDNKIVLSRSDVVKIAVKMLATGGTDDMLIKIISQYGK